MIETTASVWVDARDFEIDSAKSERIDMGFEMARVGSDFSTASASGRWRASAGSFD